MKEYKRVVVLAPGKVNLYLDITGTDDRGYHTLDTVMQSISLSDLVVVSRTEGQTLRITSSHSSVPTGEDNIAAKAAGAFFAAAGMEPQGISIHIDKRIPMEAGLAGGSADAAAVLVGLNALYGAGYSTDVLCDMGVQCGADVPFCIVGGCCRARGIGEIFTPLEPLLHCYMVIAKPAQGMSTKLAYQMYDENRPAFSPCAPVAGLQNALAQGNVAKIGAALENVFEEVCTVEDVFVLKKQMLQMGACCALMSGSGTAVYGVFTGEEDAIQCRDRLDREDRQVYLATPQAKGAAIIYIG